MSTPAPTRCQLEIAGTALIGRGLPVIPCNGKKPCDDGGYPLRNWHLPPATTERLRAGLAAATSPAVGLKLGPDSCLDMEADGPEEEAIFARLVEGCDVPRTPSFRSPRGLHRLFAWDDRLAETGAGVVHYHGSNGAKLGIRIGANGKAVHSVIPPSPGREWLPGQSLLECEPAPPPDLVIERVIASAKPALCEWHSRSSDTEGIASYDTEGHRSFLLYGYESSHQFTVADAIRWTIPSGPGHRERQIFTFARFLKLLYPDSDAETLEPLVRDWHSCALPFIATKPFSETWAAFKRAWPRVKFAAGEGPLAMIVRTALVKPRPTIAAAYDSPDLQNLVAVCAGLQRFHGNDPFFITCRDAAQYIGGNRGAFRVWNKYLNRLVADEVLRLHRQGGWMKHDRTPVGKRKRASEYYYLGDMP